MIHTHTYIYINTYTERDRGEPELAFVLSREPLQTAECELGMDPSSGRRWHLRRGQRHRQRAADCAVTWLNAKSDAADEIMATAGSWTLLEGRSVCLYVYMYIYIHIHIHIYIYIYNGLTLSAVASLGIRVAGRARLQVYSARAAASSRHWGYGRGGGLNCRFIALGQRRRQPWRHWRYGRGGGLDGRFIALLLHPPCATAGRKQLFRLLVQLHIGRLA